MFTAIDKHSATDGKTVFVRSVDRDLIEYRDGDHVVLLGIEGATTPDGGPAQIIYVGPEIRWEQPFVDQEITAYDRANIAANVVEAYRALGLESYIESR